MLSSMRSVVKRNGTIEPFDKSKIDDILNLCNEGLDLDLQPLWEKLQYELRDRITTREIQKSLIQTAINMVAKAEQKTAWSKLAARLTIADFRKEIRLQRGWENTDYHGEFADFDTWVEHLKSVGDYDLTWLEEFEDEARELFEWWKDYLHKYDPLWNNTKHMQIQKILSTYLHDKNGKYTETPEEMWLLQALTAFVPTGRRERWAYIDRVTKHFKYLSQYLIVPATPQLLNLRFKNANLSSCFIADVDDSTESIIHVQSQIALISRNAGGVGVYLGKLRPSGSWIKGSPGRANKITDWVKIYESTVNAFNQQGKRKGALTVALPIWHKDILDFLEVIDLDIGEIPRKSPDVFTQVVIPGFFWKWANQKNFYLIDLHEVTKILGREDLNLVELQGEEQEKAYEEIANLIRSGKLKNYKTVNPREIIRKIFYYWNRKGLPYVVFEDNLNKSGYSEKIYSTNLCVESFSPFNYDRSMVHTCNITNVNLYNLYKQGILTDNQKLKEFVEHLYEYMDNLLEIQNIPIPETRYHNSYYRTVTAGFLGLADLMVRWSLDNSEIITYRPTARKVSKEKIYEFIDKVFSRFLGYAYLASAKLAAKRGAAPVYREGKYAPEVEKALKHLPVEDASTAKHLLRRYGHRVTLYTTCPPNTSTSIYAGTTAGILPPFNLLQIEDQQKGVFVHFVPEYEEGYWFYDTYVNFQTLEDYKDLIDFVAYLQKNYIGSGISLELVVNHNHFDTPDKLTELYLTVLDYAHKQGVKALYYWRHILQDKTVTGGESTCESCAN